MGKITKIQMQKNSKNRVNIYIDEEYEFSCDMEIVYRYSIKANEEVNLDNIKKIVEEDNYIKAKNSALRILERSNKTESEIYKKLISKGYDDHIVKRVITSLQTYNLVDDEKYVKSYIHDKSGNQGKNKILHMLSSKGIDESIIKNSLEKVDSSIELEGARVLAVKKYELLLKRENDYRKIKQKLIQYLSYRGYSWEVINKIIRSIINGEDLEE